MVEKDIRDGLVDRLDVPVYTELPDTLPASYVHLVRSGHYIENYVHHATITMWSVAESLYEAAVLDETVQEAMEDMYSSDVVSGLSLENNYNDTDSVTREYKYRSEYLITY